MKDLSLSLLLKFIKWLQELHHKLSNQTKENLPYTSLSPIDTADIENDYKKSLDWAFDNRKKLDIKNIALTGPYGSGKSSILKTYIKNCYRSDLHFLNISLATFKEEAQTPEDESKTGLLRLIELSILQQIFYHEKDKKIPDSRFRKIKNYTKESLVTTTLVLFILLVSILNLIYPKLLGNLLEAQFSTLLSNFLHYASLTIVVAGILILIYRSIRTISGLTISKLNIQNAEIVINENISKSILNHHLDEILYFFEVTPYNVIIIEDLDRFKQTEIFTKLREINLLINSSKKIKKEVVFIYAIRDDMFKEETERTKFFDFIIPVIPVINQSNSSQKLLEKQSLNKFKISENLIDSISLFIDDMRLLHNISNEFYLYQQKLNKSLNHDKLLAIIVYKNIFPNDFTLLNNNKGILFNTINNKPIYIQEQSVQQDNKIQRLKNEVKELENLGITNIQELRYIYLLFYIPHLSGFISFIVNGIRQSPVQMASDINFERLINNNVSYVYKDYYNQPQTAQIGIQFEEIEEKVDKNITYLKRKQQIEELSGHKIEVLKKEIQEAEKVKSQLRNLRIKELYDQQLIDSNIQQEKQKSLINILLRNGFIDEDYVDYISIFYEGTITKIDHQFLINVKTQQFTEFEYKLHKIDKLIDKINMVEFGKEYTLNFSLLDYVLVSLTHKVVRDLIVTKLSDESDMSIRFIDKYVVVSQNIDAFISELTSKWDNIWIFLETKSNFTEERKNKYFQLLIEYAEIEDLKKLYNNNFFKKFLLRKKHFLGIIADVERLKIVIKSLDIKFKDIDLNEAPSELVEYINEQNYYEINEKMITVLLKLKNQFNEIDFTTKNYYAIKNSTCENLKSYIENNINCYIENLYLKLDSNTKEDEGHLNSLMNNDKLRKENKLKIIRKVDTLIKNLSSINDLELNNLLLEESKVFSAWYNVFNNYERNENKISTSVISFLNNYVNALSLSSGKIKKDKDEETKYRDFILELIKIEQLEDNNYDLILKAIPYNFNNLDLSTLSKSKVSLLIKNEILVFNQVNYDSIKKLFLGLHIQFIEKNKSAFFKAIKDYEINDNDVLKLLTSSSLTVLEKNNLIEQLDENLLAAESLKIIGEFILADNSFRVSNLILKLIIVEKLLSNEQRIKIFNWKHSQITNDYIETFLTSLDEPYSDITINGKRPLIPKTNHNLKMVEILGSKNYISSSFVEDKGIRVSTFKKTVNTTD